MRARLKIMLVPVAVATLAMVTAAAAIAHAAGYHVAKRYPLGGDGGWDYVAVDTVGNRIFIARQDRIMVVDEKNGREIGEIPGLERAHGVAFSYDNGRGFATSGEDSTVVMFDLATLKVLGRTVAAPDADAILYDAGTGRVFTFNGDSHSSTVIDAKTGKKIGAIDLGAGPEFGVTAGNGKLYVNLEDKSAIAEIDARAMKVTWQWSIAPCKSPSGLAIDRAHQRLFSGCHNKMMAISDASAGKVIATAPIGAGVDANAFDPGTQDAFSSNGDGTLTVVHEFSPDSFAVTANLPTMKGARTMGLDARTHTIHTVSAQFGPVPKDSTAANPRRWPPIVPGTFTMLVIEP